jgi:hypothetical protein
MPSHIEQTVTHGVAGTGLDAADIGDGCNVVVVQAVPKSKESGGT